MGLTLSDADACYPFANALALAIMMSVASRRARPQPNSLLMSSASSRLLGAIAVSGLLWLAVLWALA